PENKICQQIVYTLGNPILTTSATLEEDIYLSEAFEVEERLGSQIDIIIDGEPITPAPSSVISLIGEDVLVIRAGKGDISDFIL
ncbi:MAG: Sua5/YciO/YrdC/YwlC family protein, partial [Proteobacteria bacterium]|nr:Sua5/YciO/YrdC/YwlC family protein [Pseudomonadota bacterium]